MDANTIDIIQAIGTLIAVILSGASWIKYYLIPKHERDKLNSDVKKTDADTQKADADASKTFEEAAQLASNRANNLELRLTKLESDFKTEVDRLNAMLRERDQQIKNLMDELKGKEEVIAQLKDWTERLVHQIQAWGETPVPFEKPTKPRRN